MFLNNKFDNARKTSVIYLFLIHSYQVAPPQAFMVNLAPHFVLRTVRRVTVTSLREPVWVVSLDTKELGVLRVSD